MKSPLTASILILSVIAISMNLYAGFRRANREQREAVIVTAALVFPSAALVTLGLIFAH